jgi:UDP-N-acetylmuramoyl-tripeptide--D-alanyl-D-alanine ligase
MIRLTVSEIAQAVNGKVVGDGDLAVEAGVEIDSRLIKPGFLFVAKPGEQTDGHNFAGAAIEAGATALLVERELEVAVPQVIVADVVVALGLLATEVLRRLRETSKLTVIGITGSNGKTSTKNMLRAALSQFGETIAPRESFNNHVGAPLSMLLTNEETRYLVVELGADGLGSIDYLANMCKPDVAVELKVGLAHVGEFGGIEVTAKIKAEMIKHIRPGGVLVYNSDDSYCSAMADGFAGRKLSFGTGHSDYQASGHRLSLDGTSAEITYPDGESVKLQLQILGEHQVMNALATIAVCDGLGLGRGLVIKALSALPLAERWRMQLGVVDGVAIINDAYNASPDSTKAALQTLAILGRETGRRTVAVLGEMAELGKFAAEQHDAIGRIVVRLNIDQLFVVGENAKLIHMGASQEGSWDGESKFFDSIDTALEAVREMLVTGDIVLIKSSKSANLRHLGDALMGAK